jgi:hypothetical protein
MQGWQFLFIIAYIIKSKGETINVPLKYNLTLTSSPALSLLKLSARVNYSKCILNSDLSQDLLVPKAEAI